jgi:thiol-disulfide isomerase/thioredoxin
MCLKKMAICCLFCALFALACHRPQPNMPDFAFLQLNGNVFSRDDITKNKGAAKATLFIFFNPDCDHCQAEADSMQHYLPQFAPHRIVWVAVADADKMQDFDSKYHLSQNGMILVRDIDKRAGKWFAIKDVPTSCVYNKDAELVAKITGSASAKVLLKALND